MASEAGQWLPSAPPAELEHECFVATPLGETNADLDHAAYVSSPQVIATHSDNRWPMDGFTLEDDRWMARAHRLDHERGAAFTYLLLDPSSSAAVGCLYVTSLAEYLAAAEADRVVREEFDDTTARVTFWVRQDLQGSGLTDQVVAGTHRWLRDDWPLTSHLYRVLPEERASRKALEGHGLVRRPLPLPKDPRPYLWYG